MLWCCAQPEDGFHALEMAKASNSHVHSPSYFRFRLQKEANEIVATKFVDSPNRRSQLPDIPPIAK